MTHITHTASSVRIRRFHAQGSALIVAFPEDGLPEVLHWGADPGVHAERGLSELRRAARRQVTPSAFDEAWPLTILPTERDGWAGRPALAGSRQGAPLFPAWRTIEIDEDERGFRLTAEGAGLRLHSEMGFDAHGVLRVTHRVTNIGPFDVALAALDATIPVPARAGEVLDFTGRWIRERAPQRRPVAMGSFARETRRGRTGHDSPLLMVVGEPGFADRSGEVWAVHLAWSGDSVYRTDRLPEGVNAIGAGELLRADEIVLAPGDEFEAPTAWFAWSDAGLDGMSARLHASIRARAGHPRSTRPVMLNTWEAVYFQHSLPPLLALADAAAAVGVERFVLDDGWFLGRRDDSTSLGDWFADPEVWPEGLHPIIDHVRSLGMGFGLWVEPEMISPGSRLEAAHPEWVLGPVDHHPRAWRHQQVLDLARPEAFAYVRDRLDALLTEYPIEFLKWDQNRDLIEAVHAGRAGVDAHTRATYALLDALRKRHPGVEIESCASGGGRVDLGILEHTDRVWASDTNDPIERSRIQRGTEMLLPPELIGSHVGPGTAHTTGRTTDLRFRASMTLFASAGIEMDITRLEADEREMLAAWIAEYKRLRPLLHGGELVHGATGDRGTSLTGSVSADRRWALYRLSREETAEWSVPPLLMLPGLDSALDYRVRVIPSLSAEQHDAVPVAWIADGQIEQPGALLASVGLRVPQLRPGSALVIEVTAA
ncbi:alpha-galactosidase [Microbacterium nanhaiense]|nr:alpha-galactosidase [Microbacterium nanhaiense]